MSRDNLGVTRVQTRSEVEEERAWHCSWTHLITRERSLLSTLLSAHIEQHTSVQTQILLSGKQIIKPGICSCAWHSKLTIHVFNPSSASKHIHLIGPLAVGLPAALAASLPLPDKDCCLVLCAAVGDTYVKLNRQSGYILVLALLASRVPQLHLW